MNKHRPIFIQPDQLKKVKERFLKHVTVYWYKGTACWEWIGARTGNRCDFKLNGKRHTARRVAYELFVGKIKPVRACVKTECQNFFCVNPEHLYLEER